MISGGNQEISPCFPQDLQSKMSYHQMQRSYGGVKLQRGCESITVSRRVAAAKLATHTSVQVNNGSIGYLMLLVTSFDLYPQERSGEGP